MAAERDPELDEMIRELIEAEREWFEDEEGEEDDRNHPLGMASEAATMK
jgi:hypothetical protein